MWIKLTNAFAARNSSREQVYYFGAGGIVTFRAGTYRPNPDAANRALASTEIDVTYLFAADSSAGIPVLQQERDIFASLLAPGNRVIDLAYLCRAREGDNGQS